VTGETRCESLFWVNPLVGAAALNDSSRSISQSTQASTDDRSLAYSADSEFASKGLLRGNCRHSWRVAASAARRRFRTLVGHRADQVTVSSSGFAFFSRFLVLRRRIGVADVAVDLVGPDVKFHRRQAQLHSYLTDDASCGLVNGNLLGNFELWRGSTLPPSARTGHCVCGRILPATKTVVQALSSQNVSNRTTS